ncbi:MAG: phage holin family protein [Eubacteriaceae bacterium]|nr:phage holin family protein [Eubacteriaceae bacterium]
MRIDFTEIFLAVLSLISVVITTLVVPLLKEQLGESRYERAAHLAAIAVAAAEQTINGPGADKKEAVVAFLKSHGINLGEDDLDAIIESAVYYLHGRKKEEEVQP